MNVMDVKWANPINILTIECDCSFRFTHPSRISTAECPVCHRQELWHSVDPVPDEGPWTLPVMKIKLERTNKLKENEITEETQEEKDENANVVPFRVVTGGKGPPGNDWLSGLEESTVFLTRPSSHQFDKPWMEEYHISARSEQGMVCLYSNLNQEAYIWVDPVRFCRVMELVEVLRHGTSDWPNRD